MRSLLSRNILDTIVSSSQGLSTTLLVLMRFLYLDIVDKVHFTSRNVLRVSNLIAETSVCPLIITRFKDRTLF